ncbi:mid1-interacting protein 1-B [Xenopus laevis]|uniref:Mid1-interacting protein 1-B n=2 Tax=Xenopus laevis TaxID=8355 RepID=A0A1L8HBA6_XENLA|nr:mid1-interacting protein 1-B [Xenopus laevis]OCT93359.1 hypothetical protein XELAEV_18016426mg [Xenopus laevis]
MQVSQISSLTSAMVKYCAAVRHMEQEVMFPSLLRDVPMEQKGDCAEHDSGDLYDHYIRLKTIRISLESGLVPLSIQHKDLEATTLGTADNETLFYHHFTGLFSILGQLTNESNALTNRYNNIIGTARGA